MSRILCLRIENPAAQSSDALQVAAARCKQFTPLVGIDPHAFPRSVLLDITHVVHLFGGEAALVERILGALQAEGRQLRAAVADTPGAAWALAGYGKMERDDGQVSTSGVPLSPLPLEALRLPAPIAALLHSLGIWRIEQLEALPRRELSSRFGPELLDCLDRATGRIAEPLPSWDPPPQLEVRWSAEFPTARRETIHAALKHLAGRLAAMLGQAGRGAVAMECLLKSAAGGEQQVAVGLYRPSAWADHLLELLEVRLESLRLPGPVDSIRLAAISTAPLELRQQEMFCEGRRGGPRQLSGLIDRLSNRLGHASVVGVRLLPEAQPELACHYAPLVLSRYAGKKGAGCFSIASVKRDAAEWRQREMSALLPRPLRLLTRPVRLPGGIEGLFLLGGRQERIARRFGPERIETGWWRGRAAARDYYRIETAAGRCYWVFRRLPAGPWFLHGMFD